jgi:hypothetical protein
MSSTETITRRVTRPDGAAVDSKDGSITWTLTMHSGEIKATRTVMCGTTELYAHAGRARAGGWC